MSLFFFFFKAGFYQGSFPVCVASLPDFFQNSPLVPCSVVSFTFKTSTVLKPTLEFGIKNSHCRLVSMKQPFMAHNSHSRSPRQFSAQLQRRTQCWAGAFPRQPQPFCPFPSDTLAKLPEYVCSSRGEPQHSETSTSLVFNDHKQISSLSSSSQR